MVSPIRSVARGTFLRGQPSERRQCPEMMEFEDFARLNTEIGKYGKRDMFAGEWSKNVYIFASHLSNLFVSRIGFVMS